MKDTDKIWLVDRLQQEYPEFWPDPKYDDTDINGGDVVEFLCYQINELEKSSAKGVTQ